jgi:hypothetical protein
VIAKNTNTVDPQSRHVFHDGGNGSISTLTGNMSDQSGSSNGGAVFVNGVSGDVVQTFASASDLIIVTEVVDGYDGSTPANDLSIREALVLAHAAAGQQTVWLPAWKYTLTRDRQTFGGGSLTDTNETFGDLDIRESMAIQGAGASGVTSVKWRPGVVDAVFDLIGDFTGNGISSADDGWVDGSDFLIWQSTLGSTTDLRADADDDGDVDGADYSLWSAEFGNSLALANIAT